MTGTGIAALALGIMLAIWIALRMRSVACLLLFVLHLGAALFYWQFSLVRGTDAWGYYVVEGNHGDSIIGTPFVHHMVQFAKVQLEASFLDCFMIFQMPGYLGIALLYQLLTEISAEAGRRAKWLALAFVSVPSLHVWTAVMGKDSLMFLAVMCFVWGVRDPRRRVLALVFGAALGMFLRPHIVAMMMGALVLAIAADREIAGIWRLSVTGVLSLVLVTAIPLIFEYIGLQGFDPETIIEYVEERQAGLMTGGSSVDISQYSLPLKVFTYLFRPLFFDAHTSLALLVSFEHVAYIVATLLWGWAGLRQVVGGRNSMFLRFNWLFWLVSTLVFASTISNLGLAVRQKTGLLPSFFIVLLSGACRGLTARKTSVEAAPAAHSEALVAQPQSSYSGARLR